MKLKIKILEFKLRRAELELAKYKAMYEEKKYWQEKLQAAVYVDQLSRLRGMITVQGLHVDYLYKQLGVERSKELRKSENIIMKNIGAKINKGGKKC